MPQNTVTPFADEVAGGAAPSGNWVLRVFAPARGDKVLPAIPRTRAIQQAPRAVPRDPLEGRELDLLHPFHGLRRRISSLL